MDFWTSKNWPSRHRRCLFIAKFCLFDCLLLKYYSEILTTLYITSQKQSDGNLWYSIIIITNHDERDNHIDKAQAPFCINQIQFHILPIFITTIQCFLQ